MRKLFSNKWIYYIEKHRVKNSVIKMSFFAHGGISIKLYVVYLHIINECLSYKFHPYSILTGHTKVESVAYQVLNSIFYQCTLKFKMHKPKIQILKGLSTYGSNCRRFLIVSLQRYPQDAKITFPHVLKTLLYFQL